MTRYAVVGASRALVESDTAGGKDNAPALVLEDAEQKPWKDMPRADARAYGSGCAETDVPPAVKGRRSWG